MNDFFLQPGEYRVAGRSSRLHTLLGSCVSITLWHPRLLIGAMCHFLLSERTNRPGTELDGRYAAEANSLMLTALRERGVAPEQCQAKLFGGSNMFPSQLRGQEPGVGERNGRAARGLMHAWGIPIVSESLFGVGYRRIIFDIDTGDVWSRQVEPASGRAIEGSR